MTARLDWIAIGPHGVYALMDAGSASKDDVTDFYEDATRSGCKVECVPVEEACRRHREFLDRRAWSRPLAVWDLPSFLPSPAQLDLFAGARP